MNASHHFQVALLRLWRALLDEKIEAGLALKPERIERLLNLFGRLSEKAEALGETLAVAEPTETERLLFRLWPQGLPHLSDLRHLAQTQSESMPWGEVEKAAIGQSSAFKAALELALRIAATNVPVMLLGETGVGKELFATIIHAVSQRREGPFVAVNCGALPESLYVTELFGYEPGSFTGAHRQGRIGKIEAANGGTLFFDEIGDLAPPAQVALLRFLDSGEIQKIGKVKPTIVDVRVICASNRNLESLVNKGTFRQDLYYRLSLFPVVIPALRERREDIPLLAAHFLERAMVRHGTTRCYRLSPETSGCLSKLDWPGNVRQLAFALERAMLVCDHEELTPADFRFLQDSPRIIPADLAAEIGLHLEKAAVLPAIEIHRWADLLARQGRSGLSNRDVAREFDLSETAARDRLRMLCKKGILASRGEKRGRRYFLNTEHLDVLTSSEPK
jgi:transcriptional regulator with PAS, ATPase and Fis domain